MRADRREILKKAAQIAQHRFAIFAITTALLLQAELQEKKTTGRKVPTLPGYPLQAEELVYQ